MATIETTTTDAITTVTIDAPPVNALKPEDWDALRAAIDAASEDRDVRAVVVRAPEGRFCAGADISVLAEPNNQEAYMLSLVR